jgi:F420-dependent oxidoreductase-like protein
VHPLRIGIKLSQQLCSVDELRTIWALADEADYDHCWLFDHLMPIGSAPSDGDVLEGWTLLAAMAAMTERTRVGILVTGNTYRHPGLLAKMAVTVDHLSGGRLEFGLGAAWAEREHEMMGLEFGTVGQRIARLDEACQIIRSLWTQERTSFDGTHYRLEDAIAEPKPLQKPYPPIMLAGRGERKLLRVVARHADAWNITPRELDEDVRLSGVLDHHCEAIGRDPAEIRRTIQLNYAGDADEIVARVKAYLAVGFTEFVIGLYRQRPVDDAHAVTRDVLPRLRELG